MPAHIALVGLASSKPEKKCAQHGW